MCCSTTARLFSPAIFAGRDQRMACSVPSYGGDPLTFDRTVRYTLPYTAVHIYNYFGQRSRISRPSFPDLIRVFHTDDHIMRSTKVSGVCEHRSFASILGTLVLENILCLKLCREFDFKSAHSTLTEATESVFCYTNEWHIQSGRLRKTLIISGSVEHG